MKQTKLQSDVSPALAYAVAAAALPEVSISVFTDDCQPSVITVAENAIVRFSHLILSVCSGFYTAAQICLHKITRLCRNLRRKPVPVKTLFLRL